MTRVVDTLKQQKFNPYLHPISLPSPLSQTRIMSGCKLRPGIIGHILSAEGIDGNQITLFKIIGIALHLIHIQSQVVPCFDQNILDAMFTQRASQRGYDRCRFILYLAVIELIFPKDHGDLLRGNRRTVSIHQISQLSIPG